MGLIKSFLADLLEHLFPKSVMTTQITRSYATVANPHISPVVPLPEQKKKKKQKKMRGVPKMNSMTLEASQPLVATLADEKLHELAQVLIEQSRRRKYVVFLPLFLGTAKSALHDGTFTISANPNYNDNSVIIQRKKKMSGDMTLHAKKWRLIVKMDVVYGPTDSHIKRLKPVDICGVQINANGELAINADPEVMVWAERAINLHAKTHFPCIKHDCYMTFDCTLQYDKKYECIVCNTSQCPKCQASWEVHQGLNCAQFKLKQESVNVFDEKIMEMLYEGVMQVCPKCKTFTEKAEGCNKMICEVNGCNEYWCWCCGIGNLRQLKDPYDHWKHCTIFDAIFTNSEEGQQKVKDAIRDRNVLIFGDKIRPKPKELPTAPLPQRLHPIRVADILVEDPQFVRDNPNELDDIKVGEFLDQAPRFPANRINRLPVHRSLFQDEEHKEFERKEFEHKENVVGVVQGPAAPVVQGPAAARAGNARGVLPTADEAIADMIDRGVNDTEISDYLFALEMQRDV